MTDIKFLKITANSNSEFGYKLGKALKKEIQYRVEKNREMYPRRAVKSKSYEVVKKKAMKFIPSIKKHFPHLLQEATAMAKGAEVAFEDLMIVMCDEQIIDFDFTSHCTTIGLKTKDGRFLLGHNEDWFPEYRHNGLFIVNGRIKKHRFLAIGYLGSLAGSACGINNYGVAYSDTSFYFTRFEYEIPRSFHLRALLDVKTPKEAKRVFDLH